MFYLASHLQRIKQYLLTKQSKQQGDTPIDDNKMQLINSHVISVTYPGVREVSLIPGGQLIFLLGHNSICPGHINRNYCDTVAY